MLPSSILLQTKHPSSCVLFFHYFFYTIYSDKSPLVMYRVKGGGVQTMQYCDHCLYRGVSEWIIQYIYFYFNVTLGRGLGADIGPLSPPTQLSSQVLVLLHSVPCPLSKLRIVVLNRREETFSFEFVCLPPFKEFVVAKKNSVPAAVLPASFLTVLTHLT